MKWAEASAKIVPCSRGRELCANEHYTSTGGVSQVSLEGGAIEGDSPVETQIGTMAGGSDVEMFVESGTLGLVS